MRRANIVDFDLGDNNACVQFANGEALCWGYQNDGELGNGTLETIYEANVAWEVLQLNDAAQISVGDQSVCALRQTGQIACWGANSYGQLGDGRQEIRRSPHQVVPPVLP